MTRILALDTSQIQAAIVLIRDGEILGAKTGGIAVSHSEALMVLVDELLREHQIDLQTIDAFGVGVGPGSFTGIRIGCATVKALAQVLEKPIFPFSSLRALALSIDGDLRSTVAMANAYQGQVFVGWSDAQSGEWKEDVSTVKDWFARARREGLGLDSEILRLCGNGTHVYRAAITAESLEGGTITIVDQPTFVEPLGVFHAISTSSPIHFRELHANYMRPSQAEINLQARVAK